MSQELEAHANVMASMELHPANLGGKFSADGLQPLSMLKRILGEVEGPVSQIRSSLSASMQPAEALQEAYELFLPWAEQLAPAMPKCVRNMYT